MDRHDDNGEDMTKVAFLGLGQMGAPMAARLLDAGHDLTVWNRTADKAEPLLARGATAASSPAEAVADADAAITMLSAPEALDEVLFGEQGAAASLTAGQILVEMSTVGPAAVQAMTERLPDGVAVIDAPVLGSVPQATDGRLLVFIGAADEDLPRVQDLLSPMGTLRHVGGPGAGAAIKLVVNSTLPTTLAALGEAMALGEGLGLDRDAVLDVLGSSPLRPTLDRKRDNIVAGSYDNPNFKLALALKDLQLVTEAAAGAGRDLRVVEASRAWLQEAVDAGAGDLDYSAVVATILAHRTARPAG